MSTHDVDITPKIVALYSTALLAALNTPEVFVNVLITALKTIVQIDGLVMIVQPERHDDKPGERIENIARIHIPSAHPPQAPPSIHVEQMEGGKESMLEELIERGRNDLEQVVATRYPGNTGLHSYWFRIDGKPGIAACIFRAQMPGDTITEFSKQERIMLGTLEQHIGICMRVHTEMTRSRRDSFDFFADICREIANNHGLTNSESRVLRNIVEGISNKEICNELQISLATVKTHISHILQKTGCRNRADLIGKYFSSKKAIMR